MSHIFSDAILTFPIALLGVLVRPFPLSANPRLRGRNIHPYPPSPPYPRQCRMPVVGYMLT